MINYQKCRNSYSYGRLYSYPIIFVFLQVNL